jgi:hypothetical protein
LNEWELFSLDRLAVKQNPLRHLSKGNLGRLISSPKPRDPSGCLEMAGKFIPAIAETVSKSSPAGQIDASGTAPKFS